MTEIHRSNHSGILYIIERKHLGLTQESIFKTFRIPVVEPMRYIWDMYDIYYSQASLSAKIMMRLFRKNLQVYDLKSAENVDCFIANSRFVQERIKRIYGRDSTVVYPPVDIDFFSNIPEQQRSFYLYVGQLVPYKRPDIVIDAFSTLKDEKLVVVGQGPLKKQLQKKASSNIFFYDNISREKLRFLYASAKALIFPGIEDFGIIPVEAQAAGCPVIAYKAGGALETVVDGKTGTFMGQQNCQDLLNTIEESASSSYDSEFMRQHIKQFRISEFNMNINTVIRKLLE